ncbi:MAG: YbaN family protein [Spirochaetes bacterium]|nr:YbaN family protein [Spirochaetota bacterium]MBU1081383.1 YbaN family protein [Spirochaetota bacterium]
MSPEGTESERLKDPKARPVARALLTGLGAVCLLLGMLGVVVPILPTAPFILLAGFLFLRSSRRISDWLRNGSMFKRLFRSKGLTMRHKLTLLAWVWIALLVGAYLAPYMVLKVFLIALGVVKTVVLLRVVRTVS